MLQSVVHHRGSLNATVVKSLAQGKRVKPGLEPWPTIAKFNVSFNINTATMALLTRHQTNFPPFEISCIYLFHYTGPPKTGKNVDA